MHGKMNALRQILIVGQDIPYDMYCNATAVLQIDSVFKQRKHCNHQVSLREKCPNTEYFLVRIFLYLD